MMEELKLTPWEQLTLGETVHTASGFEVIRRIEFPEVDGLVAPTRLKAIVVTVRWEEQTRVRTLTFVTYARDRT
jgi:hypothetical protein